MDEKGLFTSDELNEIENLIVRGGVSSPLGVQKSCTHNGCEHDKCVSYNNCTISGCTDNGCVDNGCSTMNGNCFVPPQSQCSCNMLLGCGMT